MPKDNELVVQKHNSEPLYKLAQGQDEYFNTHRVDVTEKQEKMKNEILSNRNKFHVKNSASVTRYINENRLTDNITNQAFEQVIKDNEQKKLYDKIREIKDQEESKNVKVLELKSGSGARYMLDGENVLQFDFGGTGATELVRGKLNLEYLPEQASRATDDAPLKDMKATSRFGKIMRGMFSWLPGIWSTRQRDEYVARHNRVAAANRAKVKAAYGESVTLTKGKTTKTFKYIRRKDTVNTETGATKTRYNMAGPTLFNGGDYSLENLEEYALALGSEWLAPKLKAIEKQVGNGDVPEGTKKLHVMLQGHSRGGVAASMAAMRLNKWLHDHFEDKIANLVQFDIIQYDPVPGKFSRTGIREVADLGTDEYYDAKGRLTTNKAEARYRSLGEQQNSTLIYCLRTFRDHFFTPQQIRGAKRIILTVRDHNTIQSHELTKASNKATELKKHRSPFVNLEDQKAYRGSAINEMGEGLYFADNNNVLHRVRNLVEYRDMCDRILTREASNHQAKRQDILDSVAEMFFEAHGEMDGDVDESEQDIAIHENKNEIENDGNE